MEKAYVAKLHQYAARELSVPPVVFAVLAILSMLWQPILRYFISSKWSKELNYWPYLYYWDITEGVCACGVLAVPQYQTAKNLKREVELLPRTSFSQWSQLYGIYLVFIFLVSVPVNLCSCTRPTEQWRIKDSNYGLISSVQNSLILLICMKSLPCGSRGLVRLVVIDRLNSTSFQDQPMSWQSVERGRLEIQYLRRKGAAGRGWQFRSCGEKGSFGWVEQCRRAAQSRLRVIDLKLKDLGCRNSTSVQNFYFYGSKTPLILSLVFCPFHK